MNKFILSVFMLTSACALYAQVPVVDSLAIAKAVQQIEAWRQQYEQMLQSIALQKNQLEAATGRRNLGAILDNVATTATVPADIAQKWRALNSQEALIADALAQTSNALNVTSQRANQVRGLMAAINSTNDPKGVAEIGARIQAETALVMNDYQRVQLLSLQRQSTEQRIQEEYLKKERDSLATPVNRR